MKYESCKSNKDPYNTRNTKIVFKDKKTSHLLLSKLKVNEITQGS